MWESKVKWGSNYTLRLVTEEERGMSRPEKVMVVMKDKWSCRRVPNKISSVLELFSCRKWWFIHAFISFRQSVSVDSDGGGAVDDGKGDGRSPFLCVVDGHLRNNGMLLHSN
ncbi:hypothetical protein GOODEAATRI_028890 [Goodea atripinnis]|uniref:Uncharacterized protein n=1 Tax=Goodea atripinnis TaxID=208336 RepID=A0ABV0MW14_9TELE